MAGIFSNIGALYLQASSHVFHFAAQAFWVLQPVFFVIAIAYSVMLIIAAMTFYLLIVFDWLGNITNHLFKLIISSMANNASKINRSFLSFILRPIYLLALSSLFLLSVFIPKLSSHPLTDLAVNETSDVISGAGVFKRISGIFASAVNNLFQYLIGSFLLLKPLIAIIALIYSIMLITAGLTFSLLTPLDWLSRLFERSRQVMLRFVSNRQNNIRYYVSAFLFNPLLMTVLAPVFLALLLMPKFTSSLAHEV